MRGLVYGSKNSLLGWLSHPCMITQLGLWGMKSEIGSPIFQPIMEHTESQSERFTMDTKTAKMIGPVNTLLKGLSSTKTINLPLKKKKSGSVMGQFGLSLSAMLQGKNKGISSLAQVARSLLLFR